MYDLIIIGAGPAGLTAGIYALRANLKVIIFERETIGGQISSSPLVENYPGFTSISGVELANNLFEQYTKLGGEIELEEVLSITPGSEKIVITDSGEYKAHTIIVATGGKHKSLGIDRESELVGRGLSYCATCDGAFYKDKVVAVIGGASSAATNAIYLSNIAKTVYLIYRRSELRCEDILKERLEECNNVKIIYDTIITKLIGNDELEAIELNNNKKLIVDGVFVSVGMNPNIELVKEFLPLNEENYITSSDTKTSFDGIFVAGDVRDKELRQLTTATSDGSIAAMHAIEYIRSLK